jgi:hypothetical protein
MRHPAAEIVPDLGHDMRHVRVFTLPTVVHSYAGWVSRS